MSLSKKNLDKLNKLKKTKNLNNESKNINNYTNITNNDNLITNPLNSEDPNKIFYSLISPDFFSELTILSFSVFKFSNADFVNCSFASNFAELITFLLGSFFFGSDFILNSNLKNFRSYFFLVRYYFLHFSG